MTCQRCQERPARYHMTQVVDGQTVQELHLCEKCAVERGDLPQVPATAGADPHFSIQGLLASLFAGMGGAALPGAAQGQGPGQAAETTAAALRCPRCGHSWLEFSRTGLLGCPECYDAFSGQLEPVIRRIHGKSRHEGKVPARAGGGLLRKRELDELRRELAVAVQEQAFERAAELRDRIKELEAAPPASPKP